MELLYTLGLGIGTELVPNMVSFSTGIFLLLAMYSFCKHFFIERLEILSLFLFVTVPAVMLLMPSTYVEQGLCFFTFMAVYGYFKYITAYTNGKPDMRFLVMTGVFTGIAAGIKYTGFMTMFCIMVLLLADKNRNIRYRFGSILKYGLVVFITILPWLIKNVVNTGNPVFPFFYNLFGYKNVGWHADTAKAYFAMLTEYDHQSSLFVELFRLPWQIIDNPTRFGGGIDILGDFGWVLFLIILVAGVFVKEKSAVLKTLMLYATLHFCLWFVSKPVLRFLYPILPVLAIAAAYVLIKLNEQRVMILRVIVPVIIGLLILSNFYLYFFVQSIIDPFNVAIGLETKSEYLTRKITNSPYPAFEFMNKNLTKTDQVLFLGEQRGFYCRTARYIATNAFAQNPFIVWANESRNYHRFVDRLKFEQITHILYNKPEGERLRGYGILNFNEQGERNWTELIKSLHVVYADTNVTLFAVK
jgi:hypothetical protein